MKINIFISHSSSDKKKVIKLESYINRTKLLNAIVVVNQRQPRKLFSMQVKEGIEQCKYIIPILTKNSIQSQWVNQEIGFSEAKEKKTYPIICHDILNELKGFIHREEEHFVYYPNSKKESFDRICKDIVDHILSLEKTFNQGNFISLISNRWNPIDIPVNKSLSIDLDFYTNVHLSNPDQQFIVYFRICNDSNKKWIGFTNNQKSGHYVGNNEHLNILTTTKDGKYSIRENISGRVKQVFPDLDISTLFIDTIRFRGDKEDENPIRFYYKIE
jgi:hypothetical protein